MAMPSSSRATSGPPATGLPSSASTAVPAVLKDSERVTPTGRAHTGERPATRSSRWWRGASPGRCRTAAQLHLRTDWIDARLADVYTFRDGKAIQMRSFADRRQALEWAGV